MSATALGVRGPAVLIRGRRYPVVLPRLSDPRLHLAAVIVSLQVLGQAGLAFRVSIAQILIAVGSCAGLEVAIVFARQRVLAWPASALLTGNGTAFILRVPSTRHGDWWSTRGAWIFAAAAAAGLLSKHVLRYRGQHIFNPSNLGLVACFLLLGENRAQPLDFWWGPMSAWLALTIAITVVGGLAILARLRMLVIAGGFWLAFAAGLAIVGASGHAITARWHLGPITSWSFWWLLVTSPEILVFLFFMITDPRTVPDTRGGRLAYATAVGLLAALLVAPERTEFGAKVAVLGALALVCAARPLVALLSASRRRALPPLALAAAALYVPALVAAGLPARSGSWLPAPTAGSTAPVALPEVTIAPAPGVASGLQPATARQMAHDALADLRAAAGALEHRDATRAAMAAAGPWLADLAKRIRLAGAGAPLAVPTYHVRRAVVALTPGRDQAGPTIRITLTGTVERAVYAGSPPTLEQRSLPAPFQQTFQLSPTANRYLIVAAPGVSSSLPLRATPPRTTGRSPITIGLLPLGERTAAQGMLFAFQVVARDQAAATLPSRLELRLLGPDHRSVAFFRDTIIVPGQGRTVKRFRVTPSQWFPQLGSYRVEATADGRPGASLSFTVTKAPVEVPRFQDVTSRAGLLTSVPAAGCGTFTNGAAWGDVTGGGYPDLFVSRLGQPAQLFINDGKGHFKDEAVARGVAVRYATAAAFADYGNDGHQDLFVTRYKGGNLLFHNDGTGHFTNVTKTAGIADPFPGSSVSWGDFNGDGKLDLFVTSYVRCVGKWTTPYALTSPVHYYPDKLYRNNGNGTFTDVSYLLGQGATTGAGLAATWFVDRGKRPDLYLGNDFIGKSPDHNHLWKNLGKTASGWRLADVSERSQTALYANTMGIAVGDFEHDLRPDLVLSNIGANNLLRNEGNGTFADVAERAGVARPTQRAGSTSVTWGVGAYDFNNDGWLDLYFAAGNVTRSLDARNGPQPNELYVNDGTGKHFLDLSAASGAADPADSKGAAFADYARDGRIDIFVVDQGAAPRLYRNVTPRGQNHWLEVSTQGTVSNRDGCGARLVVTLANGARMTNQVFCTGNDKVVHFGLGAQAKVTKLDILWPFGIAQELRNVAVDRFITVREPRR